MQVNNLVIRKTGYYNIINYTYENRVHWSASRRGEAKAPRPVICTRTE